MKQSLQDYLARSLEIRRLSMAPEGQMRDAGDFYSCFRNNFIRIKTLLQQNRRTLDIEVYQPLHDPLALDAETAAELMAFSDELADTRTLRVVDTRLALMIVHDLLPYYAEQYRQGDRDDQVRYIHALYRRLVLGYNVAQSFDRGGEETDALCNTYRGYILECAADSRRFIEDVSYFAGLPKETQQELITMQLFCATGYERSYYDETLVRKQIAAYQDCLALFSRSEVQAAAPEIDWEFQIFSIYDYLSDVEEFLYWEKGVPTDILEVLHDASDRSVHYIEQHPDNYRTDLETAHATAFAISYYRGEIGIDEIMDRYRERCAKANPDSYERDEMNANLLTVIMALWLLKQHPDAIARHRDFLIQGQQSSFRYLVRARDQGSYETVQRYTSYIIEDYIDVEGGIPFTEYYEAMLRAIHPALYVHCRMVGLIAVAILDEALQTDPELLLGVQGYQTVEALQAHREELETFLMNCCLFHDAGKLFLLDTINQYSRVLFPQEFQLIQMHTSIGYQLLRRHPDTRVYAEAALYHHRWYDEKGGYPAQATFRGVRNAVLYQIITIADCFDAATDNVGRAYSVGKDLDFMLEDLHSNAGRMFSPDIVQLFEQESLQRRAGELLAGEREKLYAEIFDQSRDRTHD